jgi:hypothetical protein
MCKSDSTPGTPERMASNQSFMTSELEGGVTACWEHELQPVAPAVHNCDGSTRDIEVSCGLDGETHFFYPDEEGSTNICMTLYEMPTSELICWVSAYYNAATQEVIDLTYEEAFALSKTPYNRGKTWPLNGPSFVDDTGTDACPWPYPKILQKPQTDPPNSEIYVDDEVTVSIPKEFVEFCGVTGLDPDNGLEVSIIVNCEEYSASDDGSNYYTQTVYTHPGDQSVVIRVRYNDNGTIKQATESASFYVKDPSSGSTPSGTISSNLKHAHHINDVVENITCYSDDPDATFEWVVTRPGPDAYDNIIQYFSGPTISSYHLDLEGNFLFKCKINGDAHEVTRNVGVYSLAPPPGSLSAPFHGDVGEDITFTSPAADESLYSYTWDFMDGSPVVFGATVTHEFDSTGTYEVRLTIAYLSNPAVTNVLTQNFTVVPVDVDPPVLSIVAPPAVHEDETFSLAVGSPDTANFTYSWEFGDVLLPTDFITPAVTLFT